MWKVTKQVDKTTFSARGQFVNCEPNTPHDATCFSFRLSLITFACPLHTLYYPLNKETKKEKKAEFFFFFKDYYLFIRFFFFFPVLNDFCVQRNTGCVLARNALPSPLWSVTHTHSVIITELYQAPSLA